MTHQTPPETTSHESGHDDAEVLVDQLVEEVSIDGMCGVY
jgi:mycofactocin precursor